MGSIKNKILGIVFGVVGVLGTGAQAQSTLADSVQRVSSRLETTKNASVSVDSSVIDHLLRTEDIAFIIIDAQARFCQKTKKCGNDSTEAKCARIAAIAPEFRKASIQTYVVYWSRKPALNADNVDFYKIKPDSSDILINKHTISAFRSGSLKKQLDEDGKKKLFICGFNTSACVYSTVFDALDKGYDVTVLSDLCSNNKDPYAERSHQADLAEMKEWGAKVMTSAQALKMIGR